MLLPAHARISPCQCGLSFERLIFSRFLSCPLACERLFHTLLLARLQVIGMTLHFFDNVFRLNLTLEATKGVLQRLALLQSNFCQTRHHRSAPKIGANFSLLTPLQCCKQLPKYPKSTEKARSCPHLELTVDFTGFEQDRQV